MLSEIVINETTATAKLSGMLNTPAAQECKKEMEPLMAHADKNITIDCSGLESISSSGLRLFLALSKAAYAASGSVTLTGLQPQVKEVFDMTGFNSFINIQ